MRRRLRALSTCRRIYSLLVYGWCPACNSSPPRPDCHVCCGSREYGQLIRDADKAIWAGRFIVRRHR